MSPALTRCLSAAGSGFFKEFARAESITDGQGVGESATFELQNRRAARSHVACLHIYQLSRSAWRACTSMTNSSVITMCPQHATGPILHALRAGVDQAIDFETLFAAALLCGIFLRPVDDSYVALL